MDTIAGMNRAIEYIENNLSNKVDFNELAKLANCSVYHFQRIFSYIADVPLAEYIRRRRLTLAALELQDSKVKIIDLAIKYDYSAPNSFARAFQSMHGVTPSAARVRGCELKAFPPISFSLTVKGDVSLKYRIVKKGAFSVFGKSVKVSSVDGMCYDDIPAFIDKCEKERVTNRIVKAGGGDKKTLLDALLYDYKPDGTFRYMICMDKPEGQVPDEFEIQKVSEQTWAVFPLELTSLEGPESIRDIWKRIFPEWFPTSGYEHADAPNQEQLYRTDDGRIIVEAWVPVIKRSHTEYK